jgi:hypothetical protein
MEGVKIYGLCLERLKHQIGIAQKRAALSSRAEDRILLECYNTGDSEEIIDILELYDVEERSAEGVAEKLDELAYTVSELLREHLTFDYTSDGHLGLYWLVPAEAVVPLEHLCMAG